MNNQKKNEINPHCTEEQAGGQKEGLTQSKRLSSFDGERSYEIKIVGHLDEHWSGWLGGLEITHNTKNYTLLTGVLPDQAALHGLLNQVRDLGLVLISLGSSEINDG